MERRQEIPGENGVGVPKEDDRADDEKGTADENVAPQDSEVFPERELFTGLLTRHLGLFGSFFGLRHAPRWSPSAFRKAGLELPE